VRVLALAGLLLGLVLVSAFTPDTGLAQARQSTAVARAPEQQERCQTSRESYRREPRRARVEGGVGPVAPAVREGGGLPLLAFTRSPCFSALLPCRRGVCPVLPLGPLGARHGGLGCSPGGIVWEA
jgi:hypothetical protein